MNTIFEKILIGIFIFFQVIWHIIYGTVRWFLKIISKFCADVLKSIYGRIVAVTALIILGLIISQFVVNP